jgi:hypothetical protein
MHIAHHLIYVNLSKSSVSSVENIVKGTVSRDF